MLAARLRAAGRTAYERPYEGLWHDFLYLTPFLPESRRAWREIASFLREDGAEKHLQAKAPRDDKIVCNPYGMIYDPALRGKDGAPQVLREACGALYRSI